MSDDLRKRNIEENKEKSSSMSAYNSLSSKRCKPVDLEGVEGTSMREVTLRSITDDVAFPTHERDIPTPFDCALDTLLYYSDNLSDDEIRKLLQR